MSNKAKYALISGALIVAPMFVLADNASSTNARKILQQDLRQKEQALRDEHKQKMEALRDEFKTKREAFRDEAKKRMEALKKKLGEERAKRVEQLFNNMVRKFENAIDRLNKLADRIETLLTRAEAAGKDVAGQKEKLRIALDKISAVETALNSAKEQFNAMSQSLSPREAFQKVKTLIREVELKVKEAHRALVDAISSLKGLRLGEDKATSTPN